MQHEDPGEPLSSNRGHSSRGQPSSQRAQPPEDEPSNNQKRALPFIYTQTIFDSYDEKFRILDENILISELKTLK